MDAYRAYFQYDDEWSGYDCTLHYFADRNDAENFIIAKAMKEFPDNMETNSCGTKLQYIRDTRGTGQDYLQIEDITIIDIDSILLESE